LTTSSLSSLRANGTHERAAEKSAASKKVTSYLVPRFLLRLAERNLGTTLAMRVVRVMSRLSLNLPSSDSGRLLARGQ